MAFAAGCLMLGPKLESTEPQHSNHLKPFQQSTPPAPEVTVASVTNLAHLLKEKGRPGFS